MLLDALFLTTYWDQMLYSKNALCLPIQLDKYILRLCFKCKERKMNLRIPPRVTDRAFRKIADSCESKTLRVAVKGGGCSGFQYIFNIVDDVNENDQVFQKEESRVIIDNTSLQFLEGAEIDYCEELIGSSFKINNPNATSSCGCGTSFSFSPSFK